jgi:hypothetical protein
MVLPLWQEEKSMTIADGRAKRRKDFFINKIGAVF